MSVDFAYRSTRPSADAIDALCERFLRSPAGRMLAFSATLGLWGAGAVAFSAPGTTSVWLITLPTLLCIVGAIFSIGMALRMLLALPLVAGVYLAAVQMIVGRGGAWSAGLLAAAVVPAFIGIRGGAR